MTREEREFAKSRIEYLLIADDFLIKHDREALEMAIKALSQEPCDDAISRDAVLKKQYRIDDSATLSTRDVVNVEDIEDEPSVTQKSGKWIAQDIHNCHTDFRCSECGYIHSFMHLYGEPTADYTYCPNCGARMESEDKE